jgi:hypothetical protein
MDAAFEPSPAGRRAFASIPQDALEARAAVERIQALLRRIRRRAGISEKAFPRR